MGGGAKRGPGPLTGPKEGLWQSSVLLQAGSPSTGTPSEGSPGRRHGYGYPICSWLLRNNKSFGGTRFP